MSHAFDAEWAFLAAGSRVAPGTPRLLVAVDFSAGARAALDHALQLAARLRGSLDVLHVCDPRHGTAPGAPMRRGGALALEAPLSRGGAVRVRGLLERGDPAETIQRVADEGYYDLLVLGAAGARGAALGRTGRALVGRTLCPVLTIHAPSEESVRATRRTRPAQPPSVVTARPAPPPG